jgi:outer membrane protein assembly factor BamB
MLHHVSRFLVRAAVTLLIATCAAADEPPTMQGYWPQWRGPDRSSICPETGLLKEWPAGGPPVLWKADGLGEGVPSISVAGGRVFVLGYRGEKECLTALDEKNGAVLWSAEIGEAVREIRAMRWLSQRTPTVDGDRVYAFRADGKLLCLGTADGKVRWQKSYSKMCKRVNKDK